MSQEKERVTVQLPRDLVERVKDCVYWNRGTLTSFIEKSLEEGLKKAEKKRGEPFPKRKSELKPGRPMK